MMTVFLCAAITKFCLLLLALNNSDTKKNHQTPYHAECRPGYRPLGQPPELKPNAVELENKSQQQQKFQRQQQQQKKQQESPLLLPKNSPHSLQQQSQPPPRELSKINLFVCSSPACASSGAQATLDKLRAFAPAHVSVKVGTCSSLCTYGPIVLEQGEKKGSIGVARKTESARTHRRVRADKNDKILELLTDVSAEPATPKELIQGYELAIEGHDLFKKRQFSQAAVLYDRVIELAFQSALEWQARRDRFQHNHQSSLLAPLTKHKTPPKSSTLLSLRSPPVALEWLICVRRQQALLFLAMDDLQASLLAAQAACNLSRNTCALSCLVLAQVCRKKNDTVGEYVALKNMFALIATSRGSLTPIATTSKTTSVFTSSVSVAEREQLTSRLAQLEQQQQYRRHQKDIRLE